MAKFKTSKQRKAVMAKLRNETYSRYKKATNMSATELKQWGMRPCSKKASLSREPIKRNVHLLSAKKQEWGMNEIKGAKKTISFIARHKNQPKGKSVNRCNLSKRTIALKNWGYDNAKK